MNPNKNLVPYWSEVCRELGVRATGRPGCAIDEIRRMQRVIDKACEMRESEKNGLDVLASQAKDELYKALDVTLWRWRRDGK